MSTQHPRLALVTGGGCGPGRSTALALARDGADVVIPFRSQEEATKQLANQMERLGRKAAVLRLDTSELAALPASVEDLRAVLHAEWSRDRIDFLVNNAGIGMAALLRKAQRPCSIN